MANPRSGATRTSRRQRVTKSKQRPVEKKDVTASQLSLLDLPAEVLDLIFKEIEIHDLAVLARTSKSIRVYIEPHLYDKIYTRINTQQNTASLVRLLCNRPDIVSLIKTLVLDEYHPCHTRQLLAIKMPNLWCLLIQHEEETIEKGLGERETRILNRNLAGQPKLTHFVFWTKARYTLSKDDAALFRQPNFTRLRLSYVDFSAFENVDERYFAHKNLQTLLIECSTYTPGALKRLVTPAISLTSLTFYDHNVLPFDEVHLLPILSHLTSTLKVLKLRGCYQATLRTFSFPLIKFTALRLLHVQPFLLFGPCPRDVNTYTTHEHPKLDRLIRSRLPPNLKMLFLDCMTYPQPTRPEEELQYIKTRDYDMLQCLLEQKARVAPKLTHLFSYYMETMAGPAPLHKLADQVGVKMCALYEDDDIDPDWNWLDRDDT